MKIMYCCNCGKSMGYERSNKHSAIAIYAKHKNKAYRLSYNLQCSKCMKKAVDLFKISKNLLILIEFKKPYKKFYKHCFNYEHRKKEIK